MVQPVKRSDRQATPLYMHMPFWMVTALMLMAVHTFRLDRVCTITAHTSVVSFLIGVKICLFSPADSALHRYPHPLLPRIGMGLMLVGILFSGLTAFLITSHQ